MSFTVVDVVSEGGAARTMKPEWKDWKGGAAGQGSLAGDVGAAACSSTFAPLALQISEQNVISLLALACRFSLACSARKQL